MTEQDNREYQDESLKAVVYLILAAVVAFAVISVVLILGVILTVILTAGAAYLGYKAALNSQLWEERRVAKDKRLEAARQAEIEHFKSAGKDWMAEVVDNYYDDQERELYDDPNRLDQATTTIRKIREAFK